MSDNSPAIDRTRDRKGRRKEGRGNERDRGARRIPIQVRRTLSLSFPMERRDNRNGLTMALAFESSNRNRIDFYDSIPPVAGDLLLHAGR